MSAGSKKPAPLAPRQSSATQTDRERLAHEESQEVIKKENFGVMRNNGPVGTPAEFVSWEQDSRGMQAKRDLEGIIADENTQLLTREFVASTVDWDAKRQAEAASFEATAALIKAEMAAAQRRLVMLSEDGTQQQPVRHPALDAILKKRGLPPGFIP